jgi:hypothetical protein
VPGFSTLAVFNRGLSCLRHRAAAAAAAAAHAAKSVTKHSHLLGEPRANLADPKIQNLTAAPISLQKKKHAFYFVVSLRRRCRFAPNLR